jgi:AcrR family transcriptional regulator
MTRDAAATRERIRAAATTEFAARGIAGARVDRIAETAGCNKALLYAYFGNKEQLFDLVFTTEVARLIDATPIDAEHVAEYAARLVDYHAAHPEVVRLALWDRLERDGSGMRQVEVVAAEESKAAAIAAAQAGGILPARFDPATAIALITVLSSILPLLAGGPVARATVVEAVERLLT